MGPRLQLPPSQGCGWVTATTMVEEYDCRREETTMPDLIGAGTTDEKAMMVDPFRLA
jgi:hypothetical protein